MKNLLLSALLLVAPISFPSKWGMSLDASTAKEEKALNKYLKSKEFEYRQKTFETIVYLFKEVQSLENRIDDLENEIALMKQLAHK